MDKILEKIKGLDKKTQIALGAGIAIVFIVILILIFVLNGPEKGQNKPDETELDTQYGKEEYIGTEVTGTEILETEMLGTEMLGTEMLETEMLETEVDGADQTTGDGQNSGNGVVNGQLPSGATNPSGEEVLGSGASSTPYLETLGNDLTVKTVEIGAGQSVYYNIYRVGGMYLTINDADAYVITSSGKKYEAKNGKVSFKVENAMANEYVSFQIGNKGSVSKSFTIKFSNVTGSRQNPTVLNSLGATTDLPYGSDVGHFYKFVASQAGNIRFYIDSATNDAEISVTNNRNSMNRTFSADVKTDEQGRPYILLEDVRVGDTLMINVCALPDASWSYPATTVVWHGEY